MIINLGVCMLPAYLQRRHDGMHQFSLQVCSVSQMSFVVVKCVVQVGDWAVCKHTTASTDQCTQIMVNRYDFFHEMVLPLLFIHF